MQTVSDGMVRIRNVIPSNVLMDEWTWSDGIDFTLFSGSGVESAIIRSEAQSLSEANVIIINGHWSQYPVGHSAIEPISSHYC